MWYFLNWKHVPVAVPNNWIFTAVRINICSTNLTKLIIYSYDINKYLASKYTCVLNPYSNKINYQLPTTSNYYLNTVL